MALELRQQLKLTQQLIMTPQLQMSIKLLQLSRLELVEAIRQELEENPALEEVQDFTDEELRTEQSKAASDDTPAIKEVEIEEKINDAIDWNNYIDEYNSTGKIFETEKKNILNFESFVACKESLNDHLLWQLLMTSPTEEEEKIGSLIIGNLNKDGYLDIPVEELIKTSGSSSDKVNQVLSLIKTFEPIGVGTSDLKECLLIQAKHFKLDNTIVTDIIKNHIHHLENKNYKAIASTLKVNIQEIISAVNIIKGFEPKPGRTFSIEEPQYINPDIFVYKFEDGFLILLNNDDVPKLHVSSYYKQFVNRGGKVSDQAKEYLRDKIRSASWLIKSIQQRQKTIYKVMESILKFQREFFETGIAHLKPIVLRDVAEDIDMHESTISRVTTNKYAYTPQGLFELKYFFNSSINRINGDATSSASVQEKIRHIILNEDARKPYSDEKITILLKESNIKIARRTVTKYREMMQLLSSSKRKQF
ncbi:MAG: RNA polymerase factor sigma-54 [Desulfobacteraceae bacterium]|nr:RNA polymerase factor sigma-54 [Desulfobacteraceae bacterium]MBC2718102.1 RNA polymerase factor sigma-54 [Desulfobacteraceae bacterium]